MTTPKDVLIKCDVETRHLLKELALSKRMTLKAYLKWIAEGQPSL